MFLHELAMSCGTIVVLAIAGGFVLLPFRRHLPFALLAAPLAGLLCVVLGTSLLYSAAGFSERASGAIATAACISMTLAGIAIVRPRWKRRDLLPVLAAFATVVPVVTFATETATIRLGQPALLYMDGTDHLGYAQMGDWLAAHTVNEPPTFTPANPYQAFPELLFRRDPRFGSFFAIALVGIVRRLPCAFVYDASCAIVFASGVLAVAAVFSRRSVAALFLLIAGLLTSHWYDYSRGGYFGKLLGYPAALVVVGLFVSLTEDEWRPPAIAALAFLTAAASLMHSGMATGLFLLVLLGGVVGCRWLVEPRLDLSARFRASGASIVTLALLVLVAVVSSGIPARPLPVGFPDWHLGWSYVLPRVLDLENQGVKLTNWEAGGLARSTALGFGLWGALALVAFILRNAEAAGLLIGPALLLSAFAVADQRAAAFQMTGSFYPFMICAAGLVISDAASSHSIFGRLHYRGLRCAASAMAILAVGLRLPRTHGALKRYAGADVPARFQYTLADADRLAAEIGRESVDVELDEPNPAEFALVELGRRGLAMQLSPRAWNIVAGFTGQTPPTHAPAARFRLVDRNKAPAPALHVVAQTAQYLLLDRRP